MRTIPAVDVPLDPTTPETYKKTSDPIFARSSVGSNPLADRDAE